MHLLIAWRNLRQKWAQSVLTLLVVATSLAMTLVVLLLAAGVQSGLTKATEPFDLIVGAKGSPNQLVLNTVFLQDTPIGNVEYSLVKELQDNPLVAAAIPLGFGDNYRGFRLVGTEVSFFEHRIKEGGQPWLLLAEGRVFSASHEAVIGAKTAKETGLKIGDSFASSHGVAAGGEAHQEQKYTVVGILQPVNGPYDQGILVSLESIWEAHHHHDKAEPAESQQEIAGQHEEGEDAHEHEKEKGTTVIMVKPKGYAQAMNLYQQFQKDKRAQLIFPSQVVVQLFSILGEGEKVLTYIGYAVFAMALLLVAFSLYWSVLSRSRERAVLRAIGATAKDLFVIVLLEGVLLVWSGAVFGLLAGYGLFQLFAVALEQKTAIAFAGGVTPAAGLTIACIVLVGTAVGMLPAKLAARKSIIEEL